MNVTVRTTQQLTTRGLVVMIMVLLAHIGATLYLLGTGHLLAAAGVGTLALLPLSVLAYYSEPREVQR